MYPKNFYPRSRKSNLVVQEFANEILIYDLNENKAFSLNQTSTMVWNLCDSQTGVAEIAQQMTDRLGAVVTEDFVWLALDQLKKDNLLENAPELEVPLEGISRRDVIRRAGLASLVALPVISALIAPMAVHAQSCTGVGNTGNINGCACSANGNCTSGCCGSNGTSNACVTPNLEPVNSTCRAGCECFSACCVGGTCQGGEIAAGQGPCTTACQCASNSCNTATGVCN